MRGKKKLKDRPKAQAATAGGWQWGGYRADCMEKSPGWRKEDFPGGLREILLLK